MNRTVLRLDRVLLAVAGLVLVGVGVAAGSGVAVA